MKRLIAPRFTRLLCCEAREGDGRTVEGWSAEITWTTLIREAFEVDAVMVKINVD